MSNKTPHPHKKLIAEWLEDTSRVVEVNQHGAWAVSEFNNKHNIFELDKSLEYRFAPAKIKIGDRELVAPMRVAPAVGAKYWFLTLTTSGNASEKVWDSMPWDKGRLDANRCFETEADAIAMSEALLGLLKGGES